MQKNKSYKIILSILGILVISTSVFIYLLFRDIDSKNKHISSVLTNISNQKDRDKYLHSTGQYLDSIKSDIDEIKRSIISQGEEVDFVETLENLAKDNKLVISIDSIIQEDNPKNPNSLVIVLKIKAKTSGGWQGTYSFLRKLESLPTKIKINQFSVFSAGDALSEGSKNKKENNWQTSFELVALKYK